MVHLWFTSLLVGILVVPLAALGDTLGHKATTTTVADNGRAHRSNKEVGDETGGDSGDGKRWQWGRKMLGMEDVMKEEFRGTVITGKAKNYSHKQLGPSNTKDSSSTTVKSGPLTNLKNLKTKGYATEPVDLSNTPLGKSPLSEASMHPSLGSTTAGSEPSAPHGQHDPFQTIGTQNLQGAAAEIFKMLNRDYHDDAHTRPPINNNLPLLGDVKP